MGYMLVTNDFPPKVGGIQSYLYELFRRLPAQELTVLTTAYSGAADFDRQQPFRIERVAVARLAPDTRTRTDHKAAVASHRRRDSATGSRAATRLAWQPAATRYGVLLHGAEVTVPGRLPISRQFLRSVLCGASLAIAAGGYPAAEATRAAGARSRELSSCLPGSTTSGSIHSTPTSGWPSDAGSGCPPRAGSSSA